MNNITYTSPNPHAVENLAGKTLTGGRFEQRKINNKVQTVIRFFSKYCGGKVIVPIMGNTYLKGIYQEHLDKLKKKREVLKDIGWYAYESALRKSRIADKRYYEASFYTVTEDDFNACHEANKELDKITKRYPGAVHYRRALEYYVSSDKLNSESGREAMEDIERGLDPSLVAERLRKEIIKNYAIRFLFRFQSMLMTTNGL